MLKGLTSFGSIDRSLSLKANSLTVFVYQIDPVCSLGYVRLKSKGREGASLWMQPRMPCCCSPCPTCPLKTCEVLFWMPNPPFTGADYIEWGWEISWDFTLSFENFIFKMFVENFRAKRTIGFLVSFCGQGKDKRMALTRRCLGDVLREFVWEGFWGSEHFPLSDTLSWRMSPGFGFGFFNCSLKFQ